MSPIRYQAPTCKTQLKQVHVQTIAVSSSSGDSCPEKWVTRKTECIVRVALRTSHPHVGMNYSTCCGGNAWPLYEIEELGHQPCATPTNPHPSGRIRSASVSPLISTFRICSQVLLGQTQDHFTKMASRGRYPQLPSSQLFLPVFLPGKVWHCLGIHPPCMRACPRWWMSVSLSQSWWIHSPSQARV